MTIGEAYIHIQQGLQNIAAFVNSNIQIGELDLFWKQGTNKFIELCFPDNFDKTNVNDQKRYEAIQADVDDLRVLEILGYTAALTNFTLGNYSGKYLSLPTGYNHLLNDSTIVSKANCSSRQVPNRLTRSESIHNLLENGIYRTAIESPVSRLSGSNLYVYNTYRNNELFNIDSIIIDYSKKPANIVYGTDGTAVLEFPDYVCFKIIAVTLIYMTIVTEQRNDKIQLIQRY